jgi:hypothetical protein
MQRARRLQHDEGEAAAIQVTIRVMIHDKRSRSRGAVTRPSFVKAVT